MRWLALVAGAALLVLAFAAAGRVTDTQQGLVAEVVTLLAGAFGFLLLIYAFVARRRPAAQQQSRLGPPASPATPAPARSTKDLLLGSAGIGIALVLVAGLAISGGPLWAGLGLMILVPMLAGSVYLCVRYLRASP